MPILSYPVEVEGTVVGHAMTLGERFSFHSADRTLQGLDGRPFASLAEFQTAVSQYWRALVAAG